MMNDILIINNKSDNFLNMQILKQVLLISVLKKIVLTYKTN